MLYDFIYECIYYCDLLYLYVLIIAHLVYKKPFLNTFSINWTQIKNMQNSSEVKVDLIK